MSSSFTGPTMFVAAKFREGSVARAVWVANVPRAQATNAPAAVSIRGDLRPEVLATCRFVLDMNMASLLRSAYGWRGIVPGAQTERRGGAGPAGGLLGGKDPAGHLLQLH